MAAAADHKISVFTGPVFGTGDMSYGQTRRGGRGAFLRDSGK